MIKFDIKDCFSGAVKFTAEIDCDEGTHQSVKIGLAVKWGLGNSADLEGADLEGADLRGADLGGAPKIDNIHSAVYQAASADGALYMGDWHTCETTHCRAGWVVVLAGEEGKALEAKVGTPGAAYAIYAASDPDYFSRDGLPDFHCSNDEALADMKRLAEMEAAR